MFIIMDLHGAPGAQVTNNADTGGYMGKPQFFQQSNYDPVLQFLEWMTNNTHSAPEFRNVGALEIVNEPDQGKGQSSDMRSYCYKNAVSRIRGAENDSRGR